LLALTEPDNNMWDGCCLPPHICGTIYSPDVTNKMSATTQRPLPLARRERREVVRVEKNLNSFGFFTPSHKRLEGIQEKIVTVFVREHGGQRAEGRATILPSAKLGLPTTADQDKYYAFQKILEQLRSKHGCIKNPVSFTSAQMLRILGRKKSGQGYKEIADWMERMTLTGIRSEGVVWLAGRKKYARDTFTVFSRAVTIGQELPDGATAEENFVWLSEWQIENLNNSYVLPIDYDVYRALRLNISKALVPLIQVWFYAARRSPNMCIEKRYSELCEILAIRQYPHLSKIKEILSPSLDELKLHKVIQFWDVERTVDGSDFKLLLIPGERFLSDQRLRLGERDESPPMANPRLEGFFKALVERGIRDDRARRTLLDVPDDQEVLDQLEYGDAEIGRRQNTRDPILNPPGFYIYLVETNFPVPAGFDTTRKRELRRMALDREQMQRAQEAERQLRLAELREEYNNYSNAEIDRYIAARLTGEEVQARVRAAKAAIARERPDLRLPEPAATEFAARRMRDAIATQLPLATFDEFCREKQIRLPL
jgi:hypothetical protein